MDTPANPARRTAGAFSLIEVTLAIGLVAFALVAILGALPTGLRTVQEAAAQEVSARIAQQTQATLQQLSFAPTGATGLTVGNLAGKLVYYSAEGVETTDPATDPQSPAYYRVSFACGDPVYPGSDASPAPAAADSVPNARTITMTFRYPQAGTAPGPQQLVYSFLLARQKLE